MRDRLCVCSMRICVSPSLTVLCDCTVPWASSLTLMAAVQAGTRTLTHKCTCTRAHTHILKHPQAFATIWASRLNIDTSVPRPDYGHLRTITINLISHPSPRPGFQPTPLLSFYHSVHLFASALPQALFFSRNTQWVTSL